MRDFLSWITLMCWLGVVGSTALMILYWMTGYTNYGELFWVLLGSGVVGLFVGGYLDEWEEK